MSGSSGSAPNKEEPVSAPFLLLLHTPVCPRTCRAVHFCLAGTPLPASLECILFTMHRTSISLETFLALSINRPAGAKQVTSFRLLNFSNLVSLISQGVGLPKTSGSFRQSLLKILIIVYYFILGGDCQEFSIVDKTFSSFFSWQRGDIFIFFHILLETNGHKW